MFTDRTRLRNGLLLDILVVGVLVVGVALVWVVGFSGRVSLGHAAYFCLGCYGAGTLPSIGVHSAFLVLPGAALAGALFGLLTGAISLRATGLYFIFITLAFAQMAYYVAGGIRPLGGLDGFALKVPTTLPGGYELNQPLVLVWVSTALLILTQWGA